jgi:cytoskeletal protein RodZ
MDEDVTFAGTPASDAMRPSAGEILRAARIERGLELSQIAEQTRVRLRFLEAIENGEYSVLPALPYAIGFVKSYARAVGAPADAVAAQFRAEAGGTGQTPMMAPQIEPVDESRVPSRGLVGGAAVALVAVIAGLSAWGAGVFESTPPEPVVAQAAPAAAAPVVEAAEPQNVVVAPAAAPLPAPTATDPTLASAPAAQLPAAPVAGTVAPVAVGGPVVITATEEAWIKVYDRATRQSVKMGILKPGERYVVPADRTDLMLWTGKAGALRLSVAGRALKPLGGPQEMVRDVSLVPADLLARAG